MGERQVFQPLTTEDRVTVILYRTGIVLAAAFTAGLAYLSLAGWGDFERKPLLSAPDIILLGLYIAAGLSVLFIHLYLTRLKRYLKYLYYISLLSLAVLLYIGNGSPTEAVLRAPVSLLLLLPLSGCIGFVAAKEAFCFRLVEGYILAMLMPLFLFVSAAGLLAASAVSYGLIMIALLLLIFTLRKVFMPLAYDIGDKTAYR